MSARPPFDDFSGPAGLIDRMIGEEYEVVKKVADAIPDLAEILSSFQSITDFSVVMVALTAARDAAQVSQTAAGGFASDAAAYKAATDAFRAQAQAYAQAALVSQNATDTSKVAAATSANGANNSAIAAGVSQTAAAANALVAKDWATKTASEVVIGQGYGARKYANDSANNANSASGSATAAETARLAAVAAKNEAIAIATFDPTPYALKTYARQQAKRQALIFGS